LKQLMVESCLLRVLYLKRSFQISFAHRCRPDSADNDGVFTDCVNDFPSPEDKLPPTALAQLIENCSSLRMLKKNLRAIVDAESDARSGAWIPTRNIANDGFDVAGGFLRPD
jgi:hypothetical protein